MRPDFREDLGALLPVEMPYPYFAEREGAWLLRRRLARPARIAELRSGPLSPFLGRPGVREVTAASGDGWLHPESLLPLADPLAAFGREHELSQDRAAEAAFDVACLVPWMDYTISFTGWPLKGRHDWREMQMSRRGGNLVMQLNFPGSFAGRFRALFSEEIRKYFENHHHPVRSDGLITLAWARLDFDRDGDDLLIEEVQTDWLRSLRVYLHSGEIRSGQKLSFDQRAFLAETLETHGRGWARAMMLAVLAFAARDLDMRRVWMHQPETGAKLKRIDTVLPPRSIYRDLPRRFGFEATDRAPEFLYRARSKVLARIRRSGRPLFWRLDLSAAS
ncbi:MAG: hypothetical protein AAF409_07005 [Pseudomonadota bacterium]